MGCLFQIIGDRAPAAEAAQPVIGNGIADRQIDRSADLVAHFVEEERELQGLVQLGCHLVKAAVLAAEENREDVGIGLERQLGGEGAPGPVDGGAMMLVMSAVPKRQS